jgi:hypothetical protein
MPFKDTVIVLDKPWSIVIDYRDGTCIARGEYMGSRLEAKGSNRTVRKGAGLKKRKYAPRSR